MEEETEPPTLPKWPFYLGDGLLVGVALAILAFEPGGLSVVQTVICVGAVALGAGLALLPHFAEYPMRLRARNEALDAQNEALRARLDRMERGLRRHFEGFDDAERRLESSLELYRGASQALQRSADQFESLAGRLEAPAETLRQERDRESADFAGALSALKAELESLEGRLREAIESSASKAASAGGAEQRVEAKLADLAAAVEALRGAADAGGETAPENAAEGTAKPRAKKRRRSADLMGRAMGGADRPARHPAVSRIIEPDAQASGEPSEPSEDDEAGAQASDAGHASAEPGGGGENAGAEASAGAISGETEVSEEHEAREATADASRTAASTSSEDGAAEGQAGETSDSEDAVDGPDESPEVSAGDAAPDDAAPGETLPGMEVPEGGRERGTRAKRGDATILVSALIGIGNRPYIRGSALGLSWEIGHAMDFVEVGKWRWVVKAPEGAFECRIYQNDEIPDAGGVREVRPGEALEIEPDFRSGSGAGESGDAAD